MHAHEIQAAFDTNESTSDEILQLIESGEPYRDVLDQIAAILGLEVIELADADGCFAEVIERDSDDQKTIAYNLDDNAFELASVDDLTGDEDDEGGDDSDEQEVIDV